MSSAVKSIERALRKFDCSRQSQSPIFDRHIGGHRIRLWLDGKLAVDSYNIVAQVDLPEPCRWTHASRGLERQSIRHAEVEGCAGLVLRYIESHCGRDVEMTRWWDVLQLPRRRKREQ